MFNQHRALILTIVDCHLGGQQLKSRRWLDFFKNCLFFIFRTILNNNVWVRLTLFTATLNLAWQMERRYVLYLSEGEKYKIGIVGLIWRHLVTCIVICYSVKIIITDPAVVVEVVSECHSILLTFLSWGQGFECMRTNLVSAKVVGFQIW